MDPAQTTEVDEVVISSKGRINACLKGLLSRTAKIKSIKIQVIFTDEQVRILCEVLRKYPQILVTLSDTFYGQSPGRLDGFVEKFLKHSTRGYLHCELSPAGLLASPIESWQDSASNIYNVNLRNAVLNEMRHILEAWEPTLSPSKTMLPSSPSKIMLTYLKALMAYYWLELIQVEARIQKSDKKWLRWGDNYQEGKLNTYQGADIIMMYKLWFEQFSLLQPGSTLTDKQRAASQQLEKEFHRYYEVPKKWFNRKGDYLRMPLSDLLSTKVLKALKLPVAELKWPTIKAKPEARASGSSQLTEEQWGHIEKVLGLSKSTPTTDILKAVKKKLIKVHPDKQVPKKNTATTEANNNEAGANKTQESPCIAINDPVQYGARGIKAQQSGAEKQLSAENDPTVWTAIKDALNAKVAVDASSGSSQKTAVVDLLHIDQEKEQSSYMYLKERCDTYEKNKQNLGVLYTGLNEELERFDKQRELEHGEQALKREESESRRLEERIAWLRKELAEKKNASSMSLSPLERGSDMEIRSAPGSRRGSIGSININTHPKDNQSPSANKSRHRRTHSQHKL